MSDSVRAAPLGIFGGTFDPVHTAHLRLAEEAAELLGLATVRWIPAGQPSHRESPSVAASDRLQMVRLAIAGNPRFELDAGEVESAQPSYTVPTLERLRADPALAAGRPLVLLTGADAFAGIAGWHRWRELFSLAHIAVAHRPGFELDPATLPAALAAEYRERHTEAADALAGAPAGRIVSFAMTPLAISATGIRALLRAGRSPRYLLPSEVFAYIQNQRLYPAAHQP